MSTSRLLLLLLLLPGVDQPQRTGSSSRKLWTGFAVASFVIRSCRTALIPAGQGAMQVCDESLLCDGLQPWIALQDIMLLLE
jgi:hypothetical protein